MSRDLGLSWLALLLVGGLACAGVDDGVAGTADAAVDGGDSSWCIDPINTLPEPKPADILILFDRSGSMDVALESGTRYQMALSLLSDLVTTYTSHVRFGYQEMPGRQGCNMSGDIPDVGCCVSDPSVDLALNNAPTIVAAMTAAAPVQGSTPAAAALQRALAYFNRLQDGVLDRYVLLATHGMPSCDLDGHLARADTFDASGARTAGPCFDALEQVRLLVNAGIQVMVLDIDDGASGTSTGSPGCLDALAAAGGLPYPSFMASDSPPLAVAIQQTFGGTTTPSCDVLLSRHPLSDDSVHVLLDGKAPSIGGAELEPSRTGQIMVHFNSPYCPMIQKFQITHIEIGGCYDCLEGSCAPVN